nr:MAG TPA: tail protein [Caudoviricetes sp.]
MYNVQTINLDISLRDPTPRVVAKQGDAGSRKIMIKLYDNGIPANINNQIAPSGTEQKGVVRFCKPDGTGGIYDKTEDNLPACILGGDNITVRLAEQMLTRPGDVVADVAIICGNTVISTFNFVVHVQATPAAGVTASNNYYNYQSLADINQAIDDAKAAAAGAVKSINGSKPDSNGNVNVVAGVAKVNGKTGNVSIAANAYATCSTSAGTATKTAELVDGFAPVIGAVLAVRFTNSNTAESPRLNYDGIEYVIRDRITAQPIKPGDITAGLYRFTLISGAWILLDKLPSEGTTTPVPGDPGEDGGYWIPAVDEAGNLTWSASKAGMGDAPAAANISGPPGKDGGYYIPKISQSGSNIMQLTFDPSEPGMTSVQARQIVLPKGDPGQDGTSPTVAVATITGGHRLTITDAEGSKSADILDGVTPALQIGAVATLDPGSAATASITGTPAAPILNLGIPRGADAPASEAGVTSVNGQSGSVALALPGLGTCSSEASAQIKSISVSTAGFEARDGALLAVKFNNFPNTANGPVLEIGSKSYPVVSSASYNPPKAAALFKAVHLFILAGQAAILLDPADFAAAVEEGLAV